MLFNARPRAQDCSEGNGDISSSQRQKKAPAHPLFCIYKTFQELGLLHTGTYKSPNPEHTGNKSPNLSLHFIKCHHFPNTESENTVLKKVESCQLPYQRMIFLQSQYFENDHPCIPLTINSTHRRPRDGTRQFRLHAKPKLTLLSLSCQQDCPHLLALASAPAPSPQQTTFSHANNSTAITSSEATLRSQGKVNQWSA